MKPNPVLDELRRIARQHRGLLKPGDVVKAAVRPGSALHQRFTWDDRKAADAHRLWEARELIAQHWTAEPWSDGQPIRMLLSLESDRATQGGYRFSEDVLSDPGQRHEWLMMALGDFSRLERSYGALSELTPIFAAIHRVEAKYKSDDLAA